MNQTKVDVLIIGNGFAGIVAANRLADAGVDVVLLDENIHIGGQLLRQIPERLGARRVYHPDHVKKTGFISSPALKAKKITVLNRTRVLGIYPGREVLIEENEKKVRTLKAERIILATGAREKFLPFRGWTMPGVLSGGAVQVLIKSSGVLPARDLVIGGSGAFPVFRGLRMPEGRGPGPGRARTDRRCSTSCRWPGSCCTSCPN